jgi:hypothetical protein
MNECREGLNTFLKVFLDLSIEISYDKIRWETANIALWGSSSVERMSDCNTQSTNRCGALAQLVECHTGSVDVSGSSPLCSTNQPLEYGVSGNQAVFSFNY